MFYITEKPDMKYSRSNVSLLTQLPQAGRTKPQETDMFRYSHGCKTCSYTEIREASYSPTSIKEKPSKPLAESE